MEGTQAQRVQDECLLWLVCGTRSVTTFHSSKVVCNPKLNRYVRYCEVRALFVLLLDIVWHNITWHLLINWECPTLITWMVNTISNDNYLSSPVLGGESGNEVTLVLISHLESTTGHETLWGLLNSMLLPQPEEPNSGTNSPFATVKVNAFNTSRRMPFCVKPLHEVFYFKHNRVGRVRTPLPDLRVSHCVSSLESRLSILDFVSQLWRKSRMVSLDSTVYATLFTAKCVVIY